MSQGYSLSIPQTSVIIGKDNEKEKNKMELDNVQDNQNEIHSESQNSEQMMTTKSDSKQSNKSGMKQSNDITMKNSNDEQVQHHIYALHAIQPQPRQTQSNESSAEAIMPTIGPKRSISREQH